MSKPGEILRRLRMLFHRSQLDADLEEEMRLHRDLRAPAADGSRPRANRRPPRSQRQIRQHHPHPGEKPYDMGMGKSRKLLARHRTTACAPCCAALRSPSSRCSRSPSASAPTPPSSASSTPSCCALCPSRIRNSWLYSGKRRIGIGNDFRHSPSSYSYPFYRQFQQKKRRLLRRRRHLQHEQRGARLR